MADDNIKKIMQKRELLRQEIEKIDSFLNLYRELTGTDAVRNEPKAVSGDVEKLRSRGRKRMPGTVGPSDLGPMMRRILLEHGKPMTRTQLLDALVARDVKLAGGDKSKYLGTIIWRMREAFINLDGHGYWPKDKPYQAAGYAPHGWENIDIFERPDGTS